MEKIMLTVLTDPKKITRAQKWFLGEMKAGASRSSGDIGYRGGGLTASVYDIGQGVWFAVSESHNRYWNAFLRADPTIGGNPAPVVEVNPPYEGIDRSCRGVFLEDEKQRLFLGHRGRLGGGREGIGGNFLGWYPDSMKRVVIDGDRETELLLIGEIGTRRFRNLVIQFVLLAERFKEGKSPKSDDVQDLERDYYFDEFSGVAEYDVEEGRRKADFIHGRLVRALRDELKQRSVPVAKDKARDLYIPDDAGRADILFEVKSSSDTQSIYTAIGQLTWNADLRSQKVLVVPDTLEDEARQRAEDLGFAVLVWSGDKKFEFVGLEEVLSLRSSSRAFG